MSRVEPVNINPALTSDPFDFSGCDYQMYVRYNVEPGYNNGEATDVEYYLKVDSGQLANRYMNESDKFVLFQESPQVEPVVKNDLPVTEMKITLVADGCPIKEFANFSELEGSEFWGRVDGRAKDTFRAIIDLAEGPYQYNKWGLFKFGPASTMWDYLAEQGLKPEFPFSSFVKVAVAYIIYNEVGKSRKKNKSKS